jgi:iron(III) transport system ATP-binding protein
VDSSSDRKNRVRPGMTIAPNSKPTPAIRGEGAPPAVVIEGLTKQFRRSDGSAVNAIDNTDLTVDQGEFVVLLGPSGCGKTTLLRSLAGLIRPDAGRILLNGECVFSSEDNVFAPPQGRPLSMIFQSYALWPHMTAARNVAYPLECRRPRLDRAEIARRVRETLELVGIAELSDQHPSQMSGGQQQRVALARALVGGDQLVLFDEPLSNVDAKVRSQLRAEMLAMQRRIGFAAVYVTHDQAEAMQLADRIAVIGSGQLLQFDSPRAVYEHPKTRYVANFVGSAVEVEGVIRETGATTVIDTKLGEIRSNNAPTDFAQGTPVVALWRPERAVLHKADDRAEGWPVVIDEVSYVGTHLEVAVLLQNQTMLVRTQTSQTWSPGEHALMSVPEIHVSVLDSQYLPSGSIGEQPAEPEAV